MPGEAEMVFLSFGSLMMMNKGSSEGPKRIEIMRSGFRTSSLLHCFSLGEKL